MPPKINPSKSSNAMALVITLLIVTLATFASVAFFSRIASNRTVEQRRASLIQSDQLALSAADYVASLFMNEIRDPARSGTDTQGDVTIYWPLSGTSAVPKRNFDKISKNDPAFRNLVRQSGTSTDASGTRTEEYASADSTATASMNKRMITGTSWSAPTLTGTSFRDDQVPNWIYVLSSGSLTKTASSDVVGRFAYNVYNVGGLLDANIAGHPPVVTGTELANIKAFQAGADLTLIPGVTNLKPFTDWRNPASGATSKGYSDAVRTGGTTGFLARLNPGDNRFTGRQDLIKLAVSGSYGLPPSALPYLTTFSRAVNAPSWRPMFDGTSAVFRYKTNANQTMAINRNLPNVRVTTAFNRRGGAPAVIGEPLLKYRFPLGKIDLLANGSGASPSDILSWFGLTSTSEGWTYDHGTPKAIKTLDQVASDGREPDFFEILKAVLLDGSLGQTPGSFCTDLNSDKGPVGKGFDGYSSYTDLQILRIGASIIDQYDADSYPTAIYLGRAGSVTSDAYVDRMLDTAYGVENLPYLYRVVHYMSSTGASKEYLAGWKQPVIWNPHAERLSGAAGVPANFRVRAAGAVYLECTIPVVNSKPFPRTYSKISGTMIFSGENLPFPLATAENARSNPVPLSQPTTAADPILAGGPGILCGYFKTADGVQEAVTFYNSKPQLAYKPADYQYDTSQKLVGYICPYPDVTLSLEYETPSGTFLPYDHIARDAVKEIYYAPTTGLTVDPTNFANTHTRVDPRTDRFSASQNSVGPNPNALRMAMNETLAESRYFWKAGPRESAGFNYSPQYTLQNSPPDQLWLGELARNLMKFGNNAYYIDPDGIVRPADAAKAVGTGTANGHPGYIGGTTDPRRPIILNRPFRSVAELGYAFRDQPFASVNFSPDSSELSGDLGMLDVFCLNEEPALVAGQIDPNSAPTEVLAALLKDANRQDGIASSTPISATDANKIAGQLVSKIFVSGSFVANRGDLAVSLANSLNTIGGTENYNKNLRETSIRALAPVANTRTWNLMADIVVQTGRFPIASKISPDAFAVTGERRTWTHMAIDRYTGKLVDSKMESVNE